MSSTATEARGQGRACKKCNVKIAPYEQCVEVDNLPYHTGCNPLTVKPTRAQQGTVTADFVGKLLRPANAYRT